MTNYNVPSREELLFAETPVKLPVVSITPTGRASKATYRFKTETDKDAFVVSLDAREILSGIKWPP
jgi:hypothetical protein